MLLKLKLHPFLTLLLLFVTSFVFAQQASKHTVTKGESIYTISKQYQVTDAAIYELNPALKGKTLQLNAVVLIPFRKDNNGNIIVETHTIASGETLNLIAEKYKMSTSTLSKLNPKVDSRRLKIGTVLNLTETKIEVIKNTEKENSTDKIASKTHTIASGETLSVIANKYNMSLAELSKLNPTADSRRLHVGTVLNVAENSNSNNTKNIETVIKQETSLEVIAQKTHTVTSGETLSVIASKYNMTLAALTNLNPTADAKRLHVGTVLKIVKDDIIATNSEEIEVLNTVEKSADTKIQKTHSIASGETLKIIADKYNMTLNALSKLNPTADSRRLKVGAKLIVVDQSESNSDITVLEKTTLEKTVVTKPSKTHKIKSGDTFKSIAKKYKVSVRELTKLNPSIEPRNLKIGTIIKLNKPESIMVMFNKNESALNAQLNEAEDITHKVLPNETKYGIAKKYGITVENIDELNPEVKDRLLVDYLLVIRRGEKSTKELNPEVIEESKKSETTAMIAEILIDNAAKYMGISYRSGGTSSKGFDCSGLMYTTFKEIDLNLPRSSRSMAKVGEVVSKSRAQKGDLIFFATGRKGTISHVGMVTEVNGDEIKFIHSSTSSGVMISSVKEDYYSRRFVQINRVLN